MTATHATSLFLLCNEDNSEIMTPSLLLPFNQDNPAITTSTHASLLLPFNQDKSAIMMATHAAYSLQLIVESIANSLQLIIEYLLLPRILNAQQL